MTLNSEQLNPHTITLVGKSELLKPVILQILAINKLLQGKDVGEIYGIPTTQFQSEVYFHPQVKLHFIQTHENHAQFTPHLPRLVTAEVSYRLMTVTTTTISAGFISELRLKISSLFGGKEPFKWEKGKTRYTYSDATKGYSFQLDAVNFTQAELVINRVLELNQHVIDLKRVQIHTSEEPGIVYPNEPQPVEVAGVEYPGIHLRPVAIVQFYKAELHLHGVKKAISLYHHA